MPRQRRRPGGPDVNKQDRESLPSPRSSPPPSLEERLLNCKQFSSPTSVTCNPYAPFQQYNETPRKHHHTLNASPPRTRFPEQPNLLGTPVSPTKSSLTLPTADSSSFQRYHEEEDSEEEPEDDELETPQGLEEEEEEPEQNQHPSVWFLPGITGRARCLGGSSSFERTPPTKQGSSLDRTASLSFSSVAEEEDSSTARQDQVQSSRSLTRPVDPSPEPTPDASSSSSSPPKKKPETSNHKKPQDLHSSSSSDEMFAFSHKKKSPLPPPLEMWKKEPSWDDLADCSAVSEDDVNQEQLQHVRTMLQARHLLGVERGQQVAAQQKEPKSHRHRHHKKKHSKRKKVPPQA